MLKQKLKRNRGIYLLPNLFTISGLFAGFYAIVAAMKGMFDVASLAVFISMIADCLDGRVARLTNTESEFGAEFDSLSDLIAFGVAPALVIYSWSLVHLGKVGWLVAFFYLAATALRLARFNVEENSGHYFKGLPSPAAAGLITGMVCFFDVNHLQSHAVYILSAIMTVIAAGLMVSSVRYYHFKQLDLRGKVPFVVILAIIVGVILIALDPERIIFLVFLLYAASGIATSLWYFRDKGSHLLSLDEE